MSLYDDVMNSKPLFGSYQEALTHYTKEYEGLGRKHGKTGNEFWEEAENSSVYTEDYRKIMSLRMSINMCIHLIKKGYP
jgi:hypothetical protein